MPSSSWSDEQQLYYDATADRYRESFEQGTPFFDLILGHYLEAIQPRQGMKILELGACGGRFTLPLLERGCRVMAVDISSQSLKQLEKQVHGKPYQNGLQTLVEDATTLRSLQESDFDCVVGAHFLHHVENIPKVLERTFRHLRPGGMAVFLEPNPWNILWYVQFTISPRRSWKIERGFLSAWPADIRRGLLREGFQGVRISTFGLFPPFVLKACPRLEFLEAAAERFPPLAFFLAINLISARRE